MKSLLIGRGEAASDARRPRVALCAVGLSLLPLAVTAQQTEDSKTELPAVYVTAQKTRQTLEQTPASVSALDSDLIHDIGADSFNDLAPYVGNTTIAASASSGQLTIRGFGTVDSNQGLDPSVGLVYDGVFYSRSNYFAAFFNDLDRVEVLRGPQGTLFGKNVTAGLINVTSAAPSEARLVQWDVESEEGGRLAFRPVLQSSLGDGLSIRFSGNYDDGSRGTLYNTFLQRRENNPQQDTTRVRLRYDPHENWTLDLGGFISLQDSNYNLFQLKRELPNLLALDRKYDPLTETTIDDKTSEDVPSQEQAGFRGVNATVKIDLSHASGMQSLEFTSITGGAEVVVNRADLDADFTPVPFIREGLAEPSPARQISQELRIAGSHPDFFGYGHGFNFVAGLFYENATLKSSNLFQIEDLGAAFAYIVAANADSSNNLSSLTPNGGVGGIAGQLTGPLNTLLNLLNPVTGPLIGTQQSARVDLDQRSKSYAMFGQFEYKFTPQFSLIGGLRLGQEDKDAFADSQATGVLIPQISDQKDFSGQFSRSEIDLSPKAGLKYDFSSRWSVYTTFARGYKSGGFNALPLNESNIEFGPEQATSYEVGTKARFPLLGGGARASLSAYSTGFDNLQVSTFQGTSIYIENAARARSNGFEADLFWLPPIDGVSLYVSSGLAAAHYTNYVDGPITADACPSTGVTGSTTCTQNLTGRPLPFAPRWSSSAIPAYTIQLPRDVSTTFAVDVLYASSRFTNADEDPRKLQAATTTINARVVLADSIRHDWSLTVRGLNLTRQVVIDQTVDQPVAPGDLAAVRTDYGRIYTAELMFRFH
jgi:outer membrane receptor protein involved in Fe transport